MLKGNHHMHLLLPSTRIYFFFLKGEREKKKGGARRNKEVCLFYTSLAIKIAIGPDYYFVFPSLYCSNFMYLIIRCSLISVI